MVGQWWHKHLHPGGSLTLLLARDVCLHIVIYEYMYFHSCNEFVSLFTCICVGFIIFLYLSK